MLSASPSAAEVRAARYSADRAHLTSLPAGHGEHDELEDLYAAAAVLAGVGVISPRTAEIVRAMLAGVAAATLAGGSPSVAELASQLLDQAAPGLRDKAARWDIPDLPLSWPGLTDTGRAPGNRDDRRNSARLTLADPASLPVDGQICTVFAVDIVGFTRPDRDDDIRRYLHQRLYEYLQRAFDDAGVPWADCFCEDRGDGALIVIPPEISVKGVIGLLPEKLRGFIRRHNHVSSVAAQMQLRAAVHVGPLEHDGHGFVGTDVNFTFRMLEARPLKQALAASGADLGLVVSDYVYRALVCRYPSLVHPGAYQAVRFQAKNMRGRAWTYLPGVTGDAISQPSAAGEPGGRLAG
jgi:hypothetical protein